MVFFFFLFENLSQKKLHRIKFRIFDNVRIRILCEICEFMTSVIFEPEHAQITMLTTTLIHITGDHDFNFKCGAH